MLDMTGEPAADGTPRQRHTRTRGAGVGYVSDSELQHSSAPSKRTMFAPLSPTAERYPTAF